MSIGSFSVKNPVLINILMVTLFVMGFISVSNMPREQFAEVPFFWVNISVPYPGVGAEDVEQLVTIPIENEMQGLDKLDEIQSTSYEGLSIISIRFKSDISINKFDKLYQDVRTRFSRVDLPENVLKESIDSFSSNDFLPVIEVVISGLVEYKTLIEISDKLTDEIEKITDVSQVELIGERDRELIISIDRSKLESLNIGINTVIRAVQTQNLNIPGGGIETENVDYLIRTVGELKNIQAFENVTVIEGTKIRDLGTVKEVFKKDNINRFNGASSITLRVSKIPKGNSVAIVNEVKKVTGKWQKKLTDDITLTHLKDSTIEINSSLKVLLNNAIFGLILLIVILFFFIGLRNALITGLGIPLTFAITFIILDIVGETFNSNTLFALVLVLGLIVDHAIVITENSFRFKQNGLNRHDAAINGTDQVVIPVIAATLTTVAAFLPLMILPGTIGRFLRIIPLTVSIALVASTFEAIFFLPSHYADWPGKDSNSKRDDIFNKIKTEYKKILTKIYKRKKTVLSITLASMILILSLTGTLKQDLFNAEDFSIFYIDIVMPSGTSLNKTDSTVRDFEKIILPKVGNKEIVSINSSIGFISSGSGNTYRGNVAQILVDIVDSNAVERRSISEIMSDIKKETENIAGPDNVFFRKAVNGPPQDPPVSFRLFGDNLEGLNEVSQRIKMELGKYNSLLNIEDDFSGGSPELKIIVDAENAAKYGLTTSAVGQFIRAAVNGINTTTFVRNNKSVDVVVKYQEGDKMSPDQLIQLSIPTERGYQIPFSSIAKVIKDDSLSSIKRVDGRRVVTISSEAYAKDSVPEINRNIRNIVESEYKLKFPDQNLLTGGEFAEFSTLIIKILQIFLIGIFLIYLILGTQFRSYSQPFLILFSVPMAFAGVVLYLLISGTPFSTTVLYAGVALAGIAVNDAIVLISFIDELKNKGNSVKNAIIQAAETRLRPILLTSLTTIAGLLPTAIGLGGSSVVWQPMASTIIFGLIFSTLTALVLIPCLYGLFYDKK